MIPVVDLMVSLIDDDSIRLRREMLVGRRVALSALPNGDDWVCLNQGLIELCDQALAGHDVARRRVEAQMIAYAESLASRCRVD